MKCPFCGHEETQVKDSRPAEDHSAIRRRRECPSCEQRFTSFERVQLREMTVLKEGGRKQPFDRDKVIKSMQIALQKRPVELDVIEKAASEIVRNLEARGEAEIKSGLIGEEVMKVMPDLDTIGYIRYASVYKDFREPSDFNAFVEDIKKIQAKGR
ncbi:MAG: transcriptional regulator NrdR [Alphaproteobacteria bacterium]